MYLPELVHINNSINYFMINIKEEQIQSLIDRLEELEILRKKYDRSEQDYLIIKKLYEDKIENEIDIKLKNTALERKKFKIEHTNNFEHINKFSALENQPEDIKIEPSPLEQFINLLEPSSLGINNEPSPAQTVAGKDTSNPFMDEAFPKSLLVQLTQQVALDSQKGYIYIKKQKAQDPLKDQVEKTRMYDTILDILM